MNILNYLNPISWLSIQPANVETIFGKIIFGVFVLLALFGMVLRLVTIEKTNDRYKKQIGGKISVMCITMGLIGIVLFFFSFENIQLFGGRFWYPIWSLGLIVWIAISVRFIKKEIPTMRERDLKRTNQLKYMPSRKK